MSGDALEDAEVVAVALASFQPGDVTLGEPAGGGRLGLGFAPGPAGQADHHAGLTASGGVQQLGRF
jgi:hypothetical protein